MDWPRSARLATWRAFTRSRRRESALISPTGEVRRLTSAAGLEESIISIALLCVTKCETATLQKRSKHFLLFPRLGNDVLQQVEVGGEGLPARGGQGVGGDGAAGLHALGEGHVARLMEGTEMRGHVAIRHLERVADLGEGKLRRRGEHGHNGQPPLLVDDAVEIEKRFRIHARRRRSVK